MQYSNSSNLCNGVASTYPIIRAGEVMWLRTRTTHRMRLRRRHEGISCRVLVLGFASPELYYLDFWGSIILIDFFV